RRRSRSRERPRRRRTLTRGTRAWVRDSCSNAANGQHFAGSLRGSLRRERGTAGTGSVHRKVDYVGRAFHRECKTLFGREASQEEIWRAVGVSNVKLGL